jgi:Oxidoreductase family, NAD-binding Rossmann fold
MCLKPRSTFEMPKAGDSERGRTSSMSKQKALKVGLVGYGFMGRAHSNAFGKVNQFFDLDRRPVLRAICGRNEAKLKTFAEQWGYQSTELDWHRLIVRADIDLIDIAAPNDMHAEIAIAAAAAGKMVMCEKPLGRSPAESARMVAAVESAGVPNMVHGRRSRCPRPAAVSGTDLLHEQAKSAHARQCSWQGGRTSA